MSVSRRWRPLVALAVVAALELAYFAARPYSTDEAARRAAELVPGFRGAALTHFSVERGGRTLKLARDGDAWNIQDLGRADPRAVEDLLAAIEFARVERTAKEGPETGLDKPRARFVSDKISVEIGSKEPAGEGVYARRNGTIVVADAHVAEALDAPLDKLRDASLVAWPARTATSIAIGPLRLERKGAGWVVFDGKAALRADPAAVERIMSALVDARADRFATAAPTGNGVAVAIDGSERARLYDTGDAYTVVRSDGAYPVFSRATVAPLLVPVENLRELRLFPFDRADITGLHLDPASGERGRVDLVRGPQGWQVSFDGGAPEPADDDAVAEELDALATLPPALPWSGAAPTKAPFLRVTLDAADGAGVSLAALAGEPVLVRRDDEPGLLVPPRALFGALLVDGLTFRPRRMLSLAPGAVYRIAKDGVTVERDPASMTAPWHASHGAVDDAALDNFLEAVDALRAERFVPATHAAGHTIAVAVRGGEHHVVLRAGTPCSANLDGQAVDAILSDTTCRALLAPLAK